MASMIAIPREGHLAAVFQMLSFLKIKCNGVTVFDPAEPEIYQNQFPTEHCSTTPYSPFKEDSPSNDPTPRGIGFTMRAFVNINHAGNSVSSRSRTAFVVSIFFSQFVAIKFCCECLRGLHYKIRMFRIPVEHPAYIFGDNQSELSNSSNPHYVLKKESSSIA